MTMMTDKLVEQLSGKECTNFRLVEGGTLILYLHSEPVDATLWIDCAWRLCDETHILAGSLDNPNDVIKHLQKLAGASISVVRIDTTTSDLSLSFSNGLEIESFGHSTDLELWEFRRADGYRIGAGHNAKPHEQWIEGSSGERP